jgi:hypothetical protein
MEDKHYHSPIMGALPVMVDNILPTQYHEQIYYMKAKFAVCQL